MYAFSKNMQHNRFVTIKGKQTNLWPGLLYDGMDRVRLHLTQPIIYHILIHTLHVLQGDAIIVMEGIVNQEPDLQSNIFSRSHSRDVRMFKDVPYPSSLTTAFHQRACS